MRALPEYYIEPLECNNIVKEAKVETLKSIAKSLLGIDLVEVKVAKKGVPEGTLCG